MLLIGSAFVLTKFGLRGAPDPVTATVGAHTSALAAFSVAYARRSSPARRSRLPRWGTAVLVLAGVMLALGWLAMFGALHVGTVVIGLPLVSTYPLVVVGLAYAMEGRLKGSPIVLGAVLLILVGADLIHLP
jgi:drug/metabolite transporter (DMT)-like permease